MTIRQTIKDLNNKFNEISITKCVGFFILTESFMRYFNDKDITNQQLSHLFLTLFVAISVDIINMCKFQTEKITKFVMLYLIIDSFYRYINDIVISKGQTSTIAFIMMVSIFIDIDFTRRYSDNLDNNLDNARAHLLAQSFWLLVIGMLGVYVSNMTFPTNIIDFTKFQCNHNHNHNHNDNNNNNPRSYYRMV
jgi:hypothetical protein